MQKGAGGGQDPFTLKCQIGAMIEIRAGDLLGITARGRFFSIGERFDSIPIAVDRVNERIAHLYETSHRCSAFDQDGGMRLPT